MMKRRVIIAYNSDRGSIWCEKVLYHIFVKNHFLAEMVPKWFLIFLFINYFVRRLNTFTYHEQGWYEYLNIFEEMLICLTMFELSKN